MQTMDIATAVRVTDTDREHFEFTLAAGTAFHGLVMQQLGLLCLDLLLLLPLMLLASSYYRLHQLKPFREGTAYHATIVINSLLILHDGLLLGPACLVLLATWYRSYVFWDLDPEGTGGLTLTLFLAYPTLTLTWKVSGPACMRRRPLWGQAGASGFGTSLRTCS